MTFNDYAAIIGYAAIGGSAVITVKYLVAQLARRRFLRDMQDAYDKAFGGTDD